MCMSPHEMSTQRIEEDLVWMRQRVAGGDRFWEWRVAEFERLLKERAEAGTLLLDEEYDRY